LEEDKALYDAIRRERKDLVEQMVRSQQTIDEARALINRLDLLLAKMQPNYSG